MISYEELSLVFDMENPLTLEYFELCSTPDDSKDIYVENHHILPKCIWEEHANSVWNLIRFRYPQHFRAHEILAQICLQKRHRLQMLKAWSMMSGRNGVTVDVTSYEQMKKEYRDFLSERMTGSNNPWFGKTCPDELKEYFRNINTGKRYTRSDETKAKMRLSFKGRKQSAEQIEKRRQSMLGKRLSDLAYERSREVNTRPPEKFFTFLKDNTNLRMTGDYSNMSNHTTFLCDKGHPEFSRRPVDIERGQTCTECYKASFEYKSSVKITKEEFEEYLKENTNLTLLSGFVNMSTKAWFQCDQEHVQFEQKPSEIKRDRVCIHCKKKRRKPLPPCSDTHRANLSKSSRRPPEEFLVYLEDSTNLQMLSEYTKMTDRVWFECDRGHAKFFRKPSEVKAGQTCKHCKAEDRLKAQNDKT